MILQFKAMHSCLFQGRSEAHQQSLWWHPMIGGKGHLQICAQHSRNEWLTGTYLVSQALPALIKSITTKRNISIVRRMIPLQWFYIMFFTTRCGRHSTSQPIISAGKHYRHAFLKRTHVATRCHIAQKQQHFIKLNRHSTDTMACSIFCSSPSIEKQQQLCIKVCGICVFATLLLSVLTCKREAELLHWSCAMACLSFIVNEPHTDQRS